MKKLTALLCTAAMVASMSLSAFAAPSPSGVGPESITVSEETAAILPDGYTLTVIESKPDNYENQNVKDVVTKFNDDAQDFSVADVLTGLGVEKPTEMKTVGGNTVDPTEYDPLTKMQDIVLTDGAEVEYDFNGEVKAVKVTFTMESLKGADPEKLLIMQVDPKTGEVYLIEIGPDDFDAETGEITVEFPCLGPFTILEKA